MKYRANHQQIQHNFEFHKIYLDNLLELEKEIQTTNNSKSNVKLFNDSTSNNMKHKQQQQQQNGTSNTQQISGLNNLGNSCFFNAILQNLAQTPHLEELLRENSTNQEKTFLIKHNDDYDSELTDQDESDNQQQTSQTSIVKSDLNKDLTNECSNEIDTNKNKEESNNKRSLHRSLRLNELTILLKEQNGATGLYLGKQLSDLIKNMNNNSGTVNPSLLFSSVCKRLPAFKGFQQQDSHELLRNLLDAIKSEELKRRQTALLDILKPTKPNTLDDLLKMKIKRYGRLASYTHIDKLFGGHLLSSIVCEECNTCIQRVEPFLDLSLSISTPPIPTQQEDLTSAGHQLESSNNRKKMNTRSSNKNKNLVTNKEDVVLTEPVLSKHLTKKQHKKAAKAAKNLKKQKSSHSKNESENTVDEQKEENDQKQKEISTPTEVKEEKSQKIDESAIDSSINDIVLSVNKLKLALAVTTDQQELSEQQELTSEPNELNQDGDDDEDEDDDEVENENDDFNAAPTTNGDDEIKYKLENSFRLEAMKILKSLQLNESQETSLSTLQSCLLKFTANEMLGDKIKCENCTKKHQKLSRSTSNASIIYTKAIKQYLICELPAVLTIHLKRFQQHGYRLEKSNKHINFPLILDMSPYTSKMCINIRRDQRNHAEHPVLYSLYGLVEHSGRLNSGHYTAYVKASGSTAEAGASKTKSNLFLGNQRLCHLNMMLKKWNGQTLVDTNNNNETSNSETNLNGNNANIKQEEEEATNNNNNNNTNTDDLGDRWFYISDSHVTEVNVAKVLKAQAYILFYERIE